MESNKDKPSTTSTTTTTREPKPLLLAASISSTQQLQQQMQSSSSDILRQSFALKSNMPPNTLSAPSPRAIAPAPPANMTSQSSSVKMPSHLGAASAHLGMTPIIRAPGAGGASVVGVIPQSGYSSIVSIGPPPSSPRIAPPKNLTPITTVASAQTILRYPLQPLTTRLPAAASTTGEAATTRSGSFQVTIVPSRGALTGGALTAVTLPSITSSQNILQLQTRPAPSPTAQATTTTSALKSSIPSPSYAAGSAIPAAALSQSQHQLIQQAQLQQLIQANKALTQTAVTVANPPAKSPAVKGDRSPATSVCLVPNVALTSATAIPIAKVYPQKQGLLPATQSTTDANAVISQLLARGGTTVVPINLQEQLQRQLAVTGAAPISSAIATSGAAGQSIYLPVPLTSATKTSGGAAVKIAASSVNATASATTLPTAAPSAVSMTPLTTPTGHFLPYYGNNIMLSSFSAPNSVAANSASLAVAPGVSRGSAAPAATLIVAATAASKKGTGPAPQIVTCVSSVGGVTCPAQIQGFQAQNLPILKVPQVSLPSGSLGGAAAMGLVAHSAVGNIHPATTLVQMPAAQHGLQQQQLSSTPIGMIPLSRPILVTTTASSAPFVNPTLSPRPSILRKRPDSASSSAAAPKDSLTPQERSNLITAASAPAVRKGLFNTAVGNDRDAEVDLPPAFRILNPNVSPSRAAAAAASAATNSKFPERSIRETSSQSSTDSAQSDGSLDQEDLENSHFKFHNPVVTGPTDFSNALLLARNQPPIINQPQYQPQPRAVLQTPPDEAISLEAGTKRPHENLAKKGVAERDMEMSPRKRLRKQQLMTKNDGSASIPSSAPPIIVAGTSAAQFLSGAHRSNLPTTLQPVLASGSAASSRPDKGATRQLSFQPNLSTAPMNPSRGHGHNGTKESEEAEAAEEAWSGLATPPVTEFESAKGEESSVSSEGEEDDDDADNEGGDECEEDSAPPRPPPPAILKKPTVSLLSFYRCTWKTRHNHFQSLAEIKVKEEKKLTVAELANQRGVTQRVSGWRLYHLSSQLEDVMEDVMDVHSRILGVQKALIPAKKSKDNVLNEDLRTLNELFEGNLQRCKLIKDQTEEAKESMMKVLEHKAKAVDIISKHHKRRPVKHVLSGLSL